MAVFHQYSGRSEQNEMLKGGCYSVVMLFILGAGFMGSIYLIVLFFK